MRIARGRATVPRNADDIQQHIQWPGHPAYLSAPANPDDRFSDYTSLTGPPDHFKETIYSTPYPLTQAQVKTFLNIYDDSQDDLIDQHIPVVYDMLTGVLGYPSAPATFVVNVPVSWEFELTRNGLTRIPIAVVGKVSGLTFLFQPKAGAGPPRHNPED